MDGASPAGSRRELTDERLSLLEERLREVDAAVGDLCDRVKALEAGAVHQQQPRAHAATQTNGPDTDALSILTLAGRTFLVLGGAYLLRALTGSGSLPPSAGVIVGLVYGTAWLGAADRAALRRPAGALFHGLASLLIACPLLLEASTRFGVLSAPAAAIVLVALTTIALTVAWHRDLRALAAIAAIAGALTAIILAVATNRVLPFSLSAIAGAAVAEVVAVRRGWRWPARIPGLAANLLVLNLLARAHANPPLESAGATMIVALMLGTFYLATVATVVLTNRDGFSVTDLTLAAMSLIVSVGVSFGVAGRVAPGAAHWLGASLLVAGIAGYAWTLVRTPFWTTRTSVILSTVALAIAVVGVMSRLTGGMRDVPLAIAALALLPHGVLNGRPWVILQATTLAVLAAFSSGLIVFSAQAWIGPLPSIVLSWPAWLVILNLVFGGLILPTLIPDDSAAMRACAVALTIIAVLSVGAVTVAILNGVDGLATSPGIVAAERSIVLAFLAIGLTTLSRLPSYGALKWLGYSVIGLAGLKLALEDLRVSSSLGIFLALGAYGAALIVTAKVLRTPDRP